MNKLLFLLLVPFTLNAMQPQEIVVDEQEEKVIRLLHRARQKSLEMKRRREADNTGLERVQKCYDIQALLRAYSIKNALEEEHASE